MQPYINNIIIVPGHASFKESVTLPLPHEIYEDRYWALQSFQLGEPLYYGEHIHKALELVNKNSLLIFSGGRTRKDSGPLCSEARTYNETAKTLSAYPAGRVVLEEYARDSFQNLDFSLKLFEKRYGYRAAKITVVGWLFKEKRFRYHADTLKLPESVFNYIGVNNPPATKLAEAEIGESKTLAEFAKSPYGDTGILLKKRMDRDPFNDGDPYSS